MAESRRSLAELRRDHPIFFWGILGVVILLISATTAVAIRVPAYQRDQKVLDQRMDDTEKETRDRILDSRTRRSQLAIALLQREMRLKALQEKRLHLAINTQDSTLALRHGAATLREVPVHIGADTVIRGPDGQTWRVIRALGERHLEAKQTSPTVTVPEWVYVSRSEPIPAEDARKVEGALGRYVLRLDDGTEIYSTPGSGPFASGVKYGAFMVAERDLAAIFEAVGADAPVYIY